MTKKPSREELQKIIDREMPGWKIVDPETPAKPVKADQTGVDIETLRRKYFGAATPPAPQRDDQAGLSHETFKMPDGTTVRKAVVKRGGKVIGRQG